MAKRYYEEMRKQEKSAAGMISEDTSKIANLPTEVMFKEYPKEEYHIYNLDDTIDTVDRQRKDDVRGDTPKTRKSNPEKY